ncbi:MAG: uroporphyrinogen decarboxylase family protein [Desulfobacterales bacterium]|jgi:uroporphyrinogen-III decarboxylase
MQERFINVASNAGEKQDNQFSVWLRGEGIPFVDDGASLAYRTRVSLIKDSVQMKRAPARIPICPSAGFFPLQYAGVSMYDAMYDYDVLANAWTKYCEDFTPDAYNSPMSVVPGRPLDILDFKLCKWPGRGVSKKQEYQYVEEEFMKADEYQDLIDDPTGYFMSTYFPRIFGSLKPLERMPLFPPVNEIPCIPPALIPFGTEEIQQAFKALMDAGRETNQWLTAVRRLNGAIMGKGFPAFSGGFTKAPFDVIGDTLRGTRGIMLDMYRHPDELIEACERITPFMVKSGVASCKASGHIMPFIPLHKGADGFMSDEQFQKFYWPSLRKLIIGLVNEGCVPQLFAEGKYNQRLEAICDVPEGKVVWWFDLTDMKRAKKTVGQVACIAGNVPISLLCTGTTEDVSAYCKDLINSAGRDGGFIFSTGAGMQGAKVENVKAMLVTAQKYRDRD